MIRARGWVTDQSVFFQNNCASLTSLFGRFDWNQAMHRRKLITAVAIAVLTGCTPLGPQTIPRDRFDYNAAISNSWKEQTLLNIVKLRYADMPLFVEVASVVSGYTLEGTVALGGTVSAESAAQGDFLSLGTSGKYIDRPTITYVPITGTKFNKSFMTPIPPGIVLFMVQSGWPVDRIFPIAVDTINGLRGSIVGGRSARAGDRDYYRVIELLRQLQRSGAVGMQIKRQESTEETAVMFFYEKYLTPELKDVLAELYELLGLNPKAQEIRLTYGLLPKSDAEIAMLTRSILQIMIALAYHVDVPADHVADGRTTASLGRAENIKTGQGRLIDIKHSVDKPDNAFTAVQYRDHWFWIDDRDLNSKRTFIFLMILFSLTESGGKGGLPLVTIPAG